MPARVQRWMRSPRGRRARVRVAWWMLCGSVVVLTTAEEQGEDR